METTTDNRKKAEAIAKAMLSGAIPTPQSLGGVYAPTWARMQRLAETRPVKPEPTVPSFRQMGIKGVSAKAIIEAVDGEKAMKKKQERLGRLLGMAYLLETQAISFVDEAEHMLDRQAKQNLNIMTPLKRINLEFDKFCDAMREHMSPQSFVRFREDIEAFDANCRAFADLAGYRQETKEDRLEGFRKRAMNLHLDLTDKLMQIREEFGEAEVVRLMETIKTADAKATQKIKEESDKQK